MISLLLATASGPVAIYGVPPAIGPHITRDLSPASDSLTFESELVGHLFEIYKLATRKPVATINPGKPDDTTRYLFSPGSHADLPLVKMRKSTRDRITHIGFDFFTPQEKTALEPVGDFLERYFLLLHAASGVDHGAFVTADGVSIEINRIRFGDLGSIDLDTLIKRIRHRKSIALKKIYLEKLQPAKHVERFILTLMDAEGNQISIDMPARRDLISGKDKKELDDEFSAALHALPVQPLKEPAYQPPDTISLTGYRDSLYISQETDLMPGLRARTYYIKKDGLVKRLYDAAYPLESLANELLHPMRLLDISLDLVHVVYGQTQNQYTINLAQLIYYLEANHAVYLGFEHRDAITFKSTHVFKDRGYNTVHLLVIDWPQDFLWSAADTLRLPAVLFSNIRFDNVNDFFGQYIEKYDGPDIQVRIKLK